MSYYHSLRSARTSLSGAGCTRLQSSSLSPYRADPLKCSLDLEERRTFVRAAAERARQAEEKLERLIQEDPDLQKIIARRAAARPCHMLIEKFFACSLEQKITRLYRDGR